MTRIFLDADEQTFKKSTNCLINKEFLFKKSMHTKIKKNPLQPVAYNHRDVLGLKPLFEWALEEEHIHKQHNRILQPGFMYRNADDVLRDAKLARVQWLTDYCCPSIRAAILLHIAKELVVKYKVENDQLNIKAHHLYCSLLNNNQKLIDELNDQLNDMMGELTKANGLLNSQTLHQLAHKLLTKNKIDQAGPNQYQAAVRLIIDHERKKKIDELVSKLIKKYLSKHQLQVKPIFAIHETHDYCFLGAIGSGKSTITKQYLREDEKTDYIVLSTDNYRVFTLPGTEDHEQQQTKDVFTRTQDSAFMIKELVEKEIEAKITSEHCRANIICESVFLEERMQHLLAEGCLTSVIAAYKGEPGFIGIVERADQRARDITAPLADQGRFVQTTALLKGHADASNKLLSGLPANVTTIVYDTNVEKGLPPIEIARIYGASHEIEITNLKVMAEFLNKKNINIAAINQIDLIYPSHNPFNVLATHPENKAKAILDLALFKGFKSTYTIKLKQFEVTYAVLKLEKDQLSLKIIDERIFMKKAYAETIEAMILRAMVRQVETGSLQASLEAVLVEGDKNSFISVMNESMWKDEEEARNKLRI